VVVGGWASNNKYSFLGGLRATANMISYEVPLGLSVLTIVILFGTLSLNQIVDRQAHYWLGFIPAWNVFCQPLAFTMFLVCIHAEANRAPFDTAEAEQELVGGYHTEYSSMRFALFFLAEYAGMITTSAVCVALFFGGWHIPWIDLIWPATWGDPHSPNPSVTTSLLVCVIRALSFFVKTLAIIGVFMWVRWSLPRFRFDQIMNLAWRALIPISLFMLLATAVTIWAMGPVSSRSERLWVPGGMALTLLIVNVVVLVVTMITSTLIPAAPDTNRKIHIPGSRFDRTPLPAGASA
jgi:NADH-quinone oxidoreductase subunit H